MPASPSRGGVLESGGVPSILRVTADAAPQRPDMGGVAPSPLLARMQAFLPQLAAANEALVGGEGGSEGCVEIIAPGEAENGGDVMEVEGAVGEREDGEGEREDDGGEDDEGDQDDGEGEGGFSVRVEGGENSEEDCGVEGKEGEGTLEGSNRAVHMDLYVDNTFGELVSSDKDLGAKPSLIEEVPSSGRGSVGEK